jgi:glucose/arabinose dehydrogenase
MMQNTSASPQARSGTSSVIRCHVGIGLAAGSVLLAACGPTPEASAGTPRADGTQCVALETRPPEAPDYTPAFAGQTRACGITASAAYEVTVVARGIQQPWSLEPLPDGSFLVTEKTGQLRHVSATGQVGAPIAGVPAVDNARQGGLLDVALSPSFATDRTIYWTFSEPRTGGNGTSVARGVLSADNTQLSDVKVILATQPTYANNMHFGSRLAFGRDGFLYVTMGERSSAQTRTQAQELGSHWGKTLRITTTGAPAPGNPFIGKAGALPEIWSLGHRNVQASAFDRSGQFWTIEHGPRGGDELNRVRPGVNYGWPRATYGLEYSGQKMAGATPHLEGTEEPVYFWSPVIAPSGAQFYDGNAFPAWRGSLFIGGLASMRLVRLEVKDGKVTGEEHLLTDRKQRIRDVRQGRDGALYVVIDAVSGELWRIAPAKK